MTGHDRQRAIFPLQGCPEMLHSPWRLPFLSSSARWSEARHDRAMIVSVQFFSVTRFAFSLEITLSKFFGEVV
jgi:hypothetical protein